MATDNREDGFGSRQRGEETSRLETRLDAESSQGEFGSSVMEGMHARMLTHTPRLLYVRAHGLLGTSCTRGTGQLAPGRAHSSTSLAIRTPAPSGHARHAEDNPQLMSSIKAAERMGEEDAAAADATRKEYLAASADGSVRRIQGDPSYGAIMPQAEDNTWDYPFPLPLPLHLHLHLHLPLSRRDYASGGG